MESIFGFFGELEEVVISGSKVVVSSATALSSCMHAGAALCWGLAILAMLTRVHSQLLWMTLGTFDPWAIIACAVRGWTAQVVSCSSLHHDDPHLGQDLLTLLVMLEFSVLIILAEAADVPKGTQQIFVALSLVYCGVVSVSAMFFDQLPNWDPDASLQILFFASMTPKSQFISAYGTMAVLLMKAAVSVILQKHDFMFLRYHYEYCLDQLDASFAKLAGSDPDCVSYPDFRHALQEIGVSDSHIFAGFNALDSEQTGRISLQQFRRRLKDVFMECPDASHEALLTKFCHKSFGNVTGYRSLDSMLGLVLSQWRRIKLDEFGQQLYRYLNEDASVERLFRTVNVRAQALLFAAIVQVGLNLLEEKDFRSVERDLTSLGMRHVGYGVHPSHLCMFQLAVLRALSDRLRGLEADAEVAWSVIWIRFIAAPFTRGRLCAENTERTTVTATVRSVLKQANSHENFIPRLAANLHNVPGGEHKWSNTVFFSAAKDQMGRMKMLVSFIHEMADKLYMGHTLSARQRLRQVLSIHVDHGIFPRHVLTFQHAATLTFREVLGSEVFNSHAETMWAVFFQTEIMDTLLLAPFAETQDKLESWAMSCKTRSVDKQAWGALMRMAAVDSDLGLKGYQRICAESWKEVDKLSVDDVVRTLCEESMRHPSWAFDRVVQNYCSTPSAVSLLE